MDEIKTSKDLLKETLDVIKDRTISSKALSDLVKRVSDNYSADKTLFKSFAKMKLSKGQAWLGSNPLVLDQKAEKKDATSMAFSKILNIISTAYSFGEAIASEYLKDYLDAMAEQGIKITIDSSVVADSPADVEATPESGETFEQELGSALGYLKTIEDYSDIIRKEHSAKSEELNFAPADTYSKVIALYRKAKKGKEIDDDLQEVELHNEAYSTALNLVAQYAKEPTSPDA